MALSLTRLRRSIVLLSVMLAGALVLAVAPAAISADDDAQSDAQSIEQFQPITVTDDTMFDLEAVAEDLDPATMMMAFMQLQDIGEIDTNLSEGSFYEVQDAQEIDAHLGGDFVVPSYLPTGFEGNAERYGVGDAGYISATINVETARAITQLLDLPADWLPSASEHETVTITLDIPESGIMGWKSGFDMLMVAQIDAPELDIPEAVDLDLLRDAIIDDPRMPDELADQLGAIDNWDNTMPVPVPEGADYEDLTIDGNDGFMLTMHEREAKGGVVVWEDGGTLHLVGGNLDSAELERIADSME